GLEDPRTVGARAGVWQPALPHLVGLPEERHLFGDHVLELELLGGREAWVVEPPQHLRDADVREHDRAACRLGRMRGEHEPDLRSARTVEVDAVELGERRLERVARDAAVAGVLAAPANAVMLLGEVRELEVEAERAQHELLLARTEAALDSRDRAFAAGGARLAANPLDQLEQPRAPPFHHAP